MPAPSLKLVSAVIGVGGVATGASYGIYQIVKSPEENKPVVNTAVTKSISELLDETTKEKKTEPAAIEKWKAYIEENKNDANINETDKLGMTNWKSVNKNVAEVPDSFVDACDQQLTVQVKDKEDSKFTNYVKWCTTALH